MTFSVRRLVLSAALAAAPLLAPIQAHANPHACVTRSLFATYSGSTWLAQTVCAANEVAVSAGGFCSAAGDMRGVSTTSGTSDRLVWLWCNQSGGAYWYAMCCQP